MDLIPEPVLNGVLESLKPFIPNVTADRVRQLAIGNGANAGASIEYLSLPELCELWECSELTVYRRRKQGLKATKIGKSVWFYIGDINEFMHKMRLEANAD